MTHRRPIIAALFALTAIGGGIAATGSAGATNLEMPRRSTTTKAPNTIPMCYAGPNCQRPKNAALPIPTTTAKKTTVTTSAKKTTKPTTPKKSTKKTTNKTTKTTVKK